MKSLTTVAVVALILAAAMAGARSSAQEASFSPYVDRAGNISLPDPETVRQKWSYLGTWAKNGEDGAEEVHEVFTQPESIAAYRRSGSFPDATVLVKEVRAGRTKGMTTGRVSWAGAKKLWFVMVKDRTDRFRENPQWGKGWGWAMFLADDPKKNVTKNFRSECLGCHIPARRTDWIYSFGYPILTD